MKEGSVQGASTPPIKGADYFVKRQSVKPMPGPVTKDGQAISPPPPVFGYTRGVGAGGARVQSTPSNEHHTKACGYDKKVGL